MEEKNPLEQTPVTLPKKGLQRNARGRPTSEKAIKFTPQPKSIISRLLRRVRKQNCDKINKRSHSVIHNVSNINLTTEDVFNSKTDSVLEETHLLNAYQSIPGTYAVDVDDNHDHCKNSLIAEEQKDVQNNTTTLWDNKCEEPTPITCYVCSHRSSSLQAHRKHLSIHKNQLYACNFPDCKYTCKLSCNLIKHRRIHTSEKPFLCDQCTFRSNFANSLKVHRRIHTSERPYGCQLCSYRCNSSSNLKKHCLHRHRNIS
ncbi:putative zinc finger protein 56 [Cydia pomonella]|uniref:putative zinc finger protein 56 n=1 Tax=Cydia pomonella TaxID=82600 RepID=UPI002ADDBA66|nr:putative zinc finger protein 56 [Cydia pomonella]